MSFMAATEKACLFSEDYLWEESGILLLNGARAYLSLSGLSVCVCVCVGGGGGVLCEHSVKCTHNSATFTISK